LAVRALKDARLLWCADKSMKLHKWAEQDFAAKCSDGDAVASPPNDDINGWDILVEFPHRPYKGPLESRPPRETAFVQVKSTKGGPLRTSIKLSNMLQACRSPEPWFIVFVAADRTGHNQRYYGRHVWKEVMYAALKAVRAADTAGRKLHKSTFSLTFSEEHALPADVVDWMRSEIDAVDGPYADAKLTLADSLGFEDGCGLGMFTIHADSVSNLVDAFLGFNNDLRASSFTYTPRRFGIADPVPEVDEKSGILRVQKEPVAPCQITIRGPAHKPSIQLEGHIYPAALPGDLGEWLRFSAPPLEMVYERGKLGAVHINLPGDVSFEVRHLKDIYTVLLWAEERVLDVQISWHGKRAMASKVDLRQAHTATCLPVLKVLRLLSSLHRAAKPEIKLKLADIDQWLPDLESVQAIVAEPSFLASLEGSSGLPAILSSVIYYIEARVADWVFRCIVMRPIQQDTTDGEIREFVLGEAQMIDSEVCPWAAYDEADFKQRYAAISDEIGEHEDVLNLGNIRERLANDELA
jgi:hypothetical protein